MITAMRICSGAITIIVMLLLAPILINSNTVDVIVGAVFIISVIATAAVLVTTPIFDNQYMGIINMITGITDPDQNNEEDT